MAFSISSFGLGGAVQFLENLSQPPKRIVTFGIEQSSLLELGHRFFVLAPPAVDTAQAGIAICQVGRIRNGQIASRPGLLHPLPAALAFAVAHPIGFAQRSVRLGVFGIEREGSIKCGDRAVDVFVLVVVQQVTAPAQELVVRRRIGGAVRSQNHAVVALDRQAQHAQRAVYDPVFHREGIADIGVKALCVELAIGLGIHQRIGHANLVAGTVQASFENQSHAETFSCLLHAGDALSANLTRRNHLQRIASGELSELCRQRFGQTVTEGLAAGVICHGGKGQDCQFNWRSRLRQIQPSTRLRLAVDRNRN